MAELQIHKYKSKKRFDPVVLRRTVLKMAYSGSTVHIGCAFSIIEILSVLYRNFLRYPGDSPNNEERDYLILSKGHGVMAQYACMHELGWITDFDTTNYFADGSELKGLSDSRVQGLEVTSGSLGHGWSVGVGIAMGLKMKGKDQKVYAVVGDGELNEGAIWEGMMFSAHHGLENLLMIVDKNGFQAMGNTEDILSLGDLSQKLTSFGFHTLEVDGHDEEAISKAIHKFWSNNNGKPKALIANTIKGKGVPFMENNNLWHYSRLDHKTFEKAINSIYQVGEGN